MTMSEVRSSSPQIPSLPYRCPKCGGAKAFSTLIELKRHLENCHSYQSPSGTNILSMGPSAVPPSGQLRNSAMYGDDNNVRRSPIVDRGRKSPLMVSFSEDAKELERQLLQAKEAERRNQDLYGKIKNDVNALRDEVLQSKHKQWESADSVIQAQDDLAALRHSSGAADQFDLVETLKKHLKVKDNKLQQASDQLQRLTMERRKMQNELKDIQKENEVNVEAVGQLKYDIGEKDYLIEAKEK